MEGLRVELELIEALERSYCPDNRSKPQVFQNFEENLTEQYPKTREATTKPINVNVVKLSLGSRIVSIEPMENRNNPNRVPRANRMILLFFITF